ncbi:MAG: hypothetical protein R3C39_10550 [Dehalococcoidia bacterium]
MTQPARPGLGAPINLRALHHLQARDAYLAAASGVGFVGETAAFARQHRPPAFRLQQATALAPDYGDALRSFVATWGLEAPWFMQLCHDLAWAHVGGRPARIYVHPLPRSFGVLEVRLAEEAPESRSEPRELAYSGLSIWAHETGRSFATGYGRR